MRGNLLRDEEKITMEKMKGAILPGNSTVEIREFEVPTPGHGEVLIKVKSSTICGSDIRCIYREHVGKGPEGYQTGIISGHEPCGQIVKCGSGCRKFKEKDRVIVYHISGCGLCNDCRRGYMISCTGEQRRAYGWQRHGGMAEYLLAEEKDLIHLPDELTYSDGAQVACGFGTAYEALKKMEVGGDDTILVVGLGPVGLATLMLAKAMGANRLIGVNTSEYRLNLAKEKKIADDLILYGDDALIKIQKITNGKGVEKSVDCSGKNTGRQLAIRAAGRFGKIALVGEGGTLEINPSPDIIHEQKTIYGSWVTSIWLMEELVNRLVKWKIHPETLITHRFALDRVGEAYSLMDSGKCGKVAVVFDEEVK